MFNIAYLTGILVILVPWNSIFIGFLATGFSFPIQQMCMGGLSHSSRFTNAPLVIGMTFLALGIIYVVIIRSAGNRHACFLPRNAHIDTGLFLQRNYCVWRT